MSASSAVITRCLVEMSSSTGPPSRVAAVTPTSESKQWRTAAAELTPDKSLARMTENARFFVGSVITVVGTLLTGLGLVSATQLQATNPVRWFSVMVVALAALAVILALLTITFRLSQIHPGNLDEVATWYRRRLRRNLWLQLAVFALIAAVVLAGGGAVLSLSQNPKEAFLSMQANMADEEVQLSAKVSLDNLSSGDVVDTRIVGRARAGKAEVTILHNITVADASGKVSIVGNVGKLKGFSSFELVVSLPGRPRAWSQTLIP
jgi:hypothetical protein